MLLYTCKIDKELWQLNNVISQLTKFFEISSKKLLDKLPKVCYNKYKIKEVITIDRYKTTSKNLKKLLDKVLQDML